jgi:hypothetical protein
MVRPGDNPMQKLAMMMAVMILGMSPAHAYSISADPGSLEVGGQVEMMPLLIRVYSDDWTLTARNTISSGVAEEYRPVESGGYFVGRTLQHGRAWDGYSGDASCYSLLLIIIEIKSS